MTDRDHRNLSIIAAALAVLVLGIVAARADGLPVVPDPTLTPGVITSADQSLVCATGDESYSREHRKTSEALKAAVRTEYHARSCGEIDHRVPLSLGSADEMKNLWCQPGPPETWNFKLKDKLEDVVWRKVCHERTMSLADAQAIFLAPDWRVGYCSLIGGPSCPP